MLRLGSDSGAAAVEFALLFPIFIMITFGAITGGIMFWHNISLNQASRDAGRYASTLALSATGSDPGTVGPQTWLDDVVQVAASGAGWGDLTNLNTSGEHGYICVAYIGGTTFSEVIGTPKSGEPAATGTGAQGTTPCFSDGRTDPRVQILVHRDDSITAILYNPSFTLRSTEVIPYERKPL
jgi:hypothetical protein